MGVPGLAQPDAATWRAEMLTFWLKERYDRSMKVLLRAVCVLAVSTTIPYVLAEHTAAEERRQIPLDEQLVEVGKKLYDLSSEVPTKYARAFKKDEAGEGLSSRLFDDAITVLSLATKQNPNNLRAQFYLGKA